MAQAAGNSCNPWGHRQQKRGSGGPALNTSRSSNRRGRQEGERAAKGIISEVSLDKLRDTLRQAEAEQTAKWVRTRHKVQQATVRSQ